MLKSKSMWTWIKRLKCKTWWKCSVRHTKYAGIISGLRHATNRTIFNITYIVWVLCRFVSVSSIDHWLAIDWVMRYLKRTMDHELHYQRFSIVFEGYNDAITLIGKLYQMIPKWLVATYLTLLEGMFLENLRNTQYWLTSLCSLKW